jgi:hypothetical protein
MEYNLHMQKRAPATVAPTTWQPLPVEERQDPAVGRRVWGPGGPGGFNTARAGQLESTE